MGKREGRRAPKSAGSAKKAGEKYAADQIGSAYFHNWVHDQLVEASRMDPSKVLPLETRADALKIARNMLQQLEWDTKHDLTRQGIHYPDSWFRGFHISADAARDGLADEILVQWNQIRGTNRRRVMQR